MHVVEMNKPLTEDTTLVCRAVADLPEVGGGYAEMSVFLRKTGQAYAQVSAFVVDGELSAFVSPEVQKTFPFGPEITYWREAPRVSATFESLDQAVESACLWAGGVEMRWEEAVAYADKIRESFLSRAIAAQAETRRSAGEVEERGASAGEEEPHVTDDGIRVDQADRALDIADAVRGIVDEPDEGLFPLSGVVPVGPRAPVMRAPADEPGPSLRDQLRDNAERFAAIAKKCLDEYDVVPSKDTLDKAAVAHEAACVLVKSPMSPYESAELLDAPVEGPARAGILAGGEGIFGPMGKYVG